MNYRDLRRDELISRHFPVLCLLAGLFLLGAVAGSIFIARFPDSASAYVNSYAERLMTASGAALFKSVFQPGFIFLALIFFCGFGRLGTLVIPAIFLVRGFTVAFNVSAFIQVYGVQGYLPAVTAEFLSGFIITACLFFLSLQSFSLAAAWSGRVGRTAAVRSSMDPAYYLAAALCLTFILVTSLLYAYFMPPLARSVLLIIS